MKSLFSRQQKSAATLKPPAQKAATEVLLEITITPLRAQILAFSGPICSAPSTHVAATRGSNHQTGQGPVLESEQRSGTAPG